MAFFDRMGGGVAVTETLPELPDDFHGNTACGTVELKLAFDGVLEELVEEEEVVVVVVVVLLEEGMMFFLIKIFIGWPSFALARVYWFFLPK
jgi:hypothetical protein